jgi:hypothetical protein
MSSHLSPPSGEEPGVERALDAALSYFDHARLQEALSALDQAEVLGIPDKLVPGTLWLRGMTHFYSGDFEHAAAVLPVPPLRRMGDRWAKNRIERITAFARSHRFDEAEAELDILARDHPDDVFLTVAIPSCVALIRLLQGKVDAARQHAFAGIASLQAIRRAVMEREREGKGAPRNFDPVDVDEAAIDLAKVLAGIGEFMASMNILEQVAHLLPSALALLERDPLLEALREYPGLGERFQAWLTRQKVSLLPPSLA